MKTPEIPFNVGFPRWQEIASREDAKVLAVFIQNITMDFRGRRLSEGHVVELWNQFIADTKKQ